MQAGTTGAGLHATLPLGDRWQARLGFNHYAYRDSEGVSQVEYGFRARLQTIDLLLDWHPRAGVFRLSAGLVYNRNQIRALARPQQNLTYTFDGRTYNILEVGEVGGRLDFRRFAPYVGVGLGPPPRSRRGWHVSLDLGVLVQGDARAVLRAPGCRSDIPGLCEALNVDLLAEEPRLRDELRDLRLFPVLRAGLHYRF